jgi:hypothetical protein
MAGFLKGLAHPKVTKKRFFELGPVCTFSAQRVEHLKPKTRLLTQDLINFQNSSRSINSSICSKMVINCSFLFRNGMFSQRLSAAKSVQKAIFRARTCLYVLSAAGGALKTENSTFDSGSNQFSK